MQVHRWYNAGAYTTSTAGGDLTLVFTRRSNGNNNSTWTATIECVDCSGGGGCNQTYTAPICFDFEDYPSPNEYITNSESGLPLCWSYIYSGEYLSAGVGFIPHIYNDPDYIHDGNGLYMIAGYSNNYDDCGNTNYAILPNITGISPGDKITFHAWMYFPDYGTLTIGYMTDRNDASTFHSIGNATYTDFSSSSADDGYNEFTIPNGWNSSWVLAFRWYYNYDGYYVYYDVLIDNICICTPMHATLGDLTFTNSTASIAAGNTYQNSYSHIPTGYTTNDITYRISPTVAGVTIDADGTVHTPSGIDQTFTVTATIDGGTDYCDEIATYILNVGVVCDSVINLDGDKNINISCDKTYCFYDSGGKTGNYSNNEDFTLTLTSTGTIHINFSDFSTESSYDTLCIKGTDHDGEYGGTTIPSDFVSTGNQIIIHWQSDYSQTYSGWKATITATDCCTDWDADFHYTTTSASIVAGTSYTNTTLVNNTAYNVSYTISPSMAGVSISSSGEVTTPANIEQTFTVTATIQRGGEYCDKKTTYTLNVGDGCAKTGGMDGTSRYTPFFGYYNHSWCQMLYTASELGNQSCHINKIAFYVSTAVNYNFPTRIYMKLVNKTTFDSYLDFVAMSESDLVWSGNWNTGTSGWNEFELDSLFEYDRDYELLIGVKWDGTHTSSYPIFQYSSTDNYTTIYAYEDDSEPDISNIGDWDWGTQGYIRFHPYMKICMDCCNLDATIQIGNQ